MRCGKGDGGRLALPAGARASRGGAKLATGVGKARARATHSIKVSRVEGGCDDDIDGVRGGDGVVGRTVRTRRRGRGRGCRGRSR